MTKAFFDTKDWPVTEIAPDKLCQFCRTVLTHSEYMTVYLQRERSCRLHLKKIAQYVDSDNILQRYVLLNDEAEYTHIISKIGICLSSFAKPQQAHLLASDQPFGIVLADLGVSPLFLQRRFYECEDLAMASEISPYPRAHCKHFSPPKFFGRKQKIFDQGGHLLADVCEWIP